jgi:methionyl-tRNA formyltransferase
MGVKLLCVATEKGLECLRTAIQILSPSELLVCTFQEIKVARSYHEDILDEAKEAGCLLVDISELRTSPLEVIQKYKVDSILCVGWRYLLPAQALRDMGVHLVIAHDSLLPKLRGFAPLPTAIICGHSETGVTFLLPGDDVDDGPILWQKSVSIDPHDTIHNLIQKLIPLYQEGTRLFLTGGFGEPMPQDHRNATYSIWRDEEDYRIDWNWDASRILRTVRALGFPYLGAQTLLDNEIFIVRRAEEVEDVKFEIRQPGKVWKIDQSGCPIVVCGRGMIKITELANKDGQSALPLKRLRIRFR